MYDETNLECKLYIFHAVWFSGVPVPAASQPVPSPVSTSQVRDIKAEPKDWEPPPPVLATPHTTQHPLDYIQEQLKQANLQVCYLKTVSVNTEYHYSVLILWVVSLRVACVMQYLVRLEDYIDG